jgi:hypothetical protein
MFVVVVAVLAAVQAVAFVVATLWLVAALIRSRPVTREEQERASMRSLSWPTKP